MFKIDEKSFIIHSQLNNNKSDFPKNKSIIEIFHELVSSSPESIALIKGEENLTYYELNQRANQLANLLIEEVGYRKRIGVSLEGSPDFIISILAILKCGGTYVPIDIGYPVDRIKYMIEDSGVSTVITLSKHQSKMSGLVNMVTLDTKENIIKVKPSKNIEIANYCESAYIIYTSGSTGKPKGVAVPHNAISRLVFNTNYIDISNEDVFLQLASVSFDAATFEVWGSLLNGSKLVLTGIEKVGLKEISDLIENHRISVIWLTSGIFHQMVDYDVEKLSEVKKILAGGDVISPSHVNKLLKNLPDDSVFINAYGPTENTTFTCCNVLCNRDVGKYTSSIPIGKPISNTEVFILDENKMPIKMGAVGELYTAGEGLALHYINKEEETKKRFLDINIYNQNKRVYKTGDLVKLLDDGNIDFIGRRDNQVKVRGFRVELGEIEKEIRKIPNVEDTVTLIKRDSSSNKVIVSYYISESKEINIKKYLEKNLPTYMIPSQIVQVDTFPLTPNGKVDRNKLMSIEKNINFRYVNPKNSTEEKLVEIWNDCFGLNEIGVTDNFFELGGHSLIATKISTRIQEYYSVDIKIGDILKLKTIDNLAELIKKKEEESFNTLRPNQLLSEKRNENELLSYAQKRMWFLNKMESDSSVYNVIFEADINGELDTSILKRSIKNIILKHDMLRTNFVEIDNKPVQILRNNLDYQIEIYNDISDPIVSSQLIETIKKEESNYKFDLSKDSLIRVYIINSGTDTNKMLVNLHHIVSDGWSMDIFFNEIIESYDGIINNNQFELPPLKIKYTDYVRSQNNFLKEEAAKNQLLYWKEFLDGAPHKIELPTDKARPQKLSNSGKRYEFNIPDKITRKLKKLSKRNDCTLYTTLFTAFNVLLNKYTNQKDLVIGTPVANRKHSELEDIIGFFVNTLPIRSIIKKDENFIELLERNNRMLLQSFSNQDIPFEKLVEEINPERDASINPLFQVMFTLQNAHKTTFENSNLKINIKEVNSNKSKFDLTLLMTEEKNDNLACTFEYSSDLFLENSIKRMAANFINLLEEVTNSEYVNISKLNIISDDEMDKIKGFSGSDSIIKMCNDDIIGIFKKIVKEQPGTLALKYYGNEITYEELDALSDRVAIDLCKRNIETSSKPIGVYINRSHEMIIAILGVLKSGNKYLPLDPKIPSERLKYIIENSKSDFIITNNELSHNLSELDSVNVIQINTKENNVGCETINYSKSSGYVIYTSGSTGKPKGVLINQENLIELVSVISEKLSIKKGKKILQFASSGFDASVFEVFSTLLTGATLYLNDSEDTLPFEPLIKTINNLEITHVLLPPSVLKGIKPNDVPSLEVVISGGEPCTEELVKKWSVEKKFFNAYGPTEATIMATLKHCDDIRKPTIGKPLTNSEVYVLDELLNIVPIGVRGELFISGNSLAEGYLNRPDLTKERFIELEIFGNKKRLYRTGDIVKFLNNGELDYLGRNDNQIKLRGFRIELGEIEETINSIDGVQESIVLLKETNQNKYIISYVVLENEFNGGLKDIEKTIKANLPEYMVPSMLIPISHFPLTQNGKIDVNALPALEINNQARLPENNTEKLLKLVFEEIIGVEISDTSESFFNLGGHSLLVTQITAKISELFSVELSMQEFFGNPDVKNLSNLLLAKYDITHDIESSAKMILEILEMSEEEVEEVLNN
ncbi:hypothetical protein A6P54_02670 [Bacillus sp. MKU004]|nr:hypothetical protein A6P54_02670 [Bacillus sp. MKU004]